MIYQKTQNLLFNSFNMYLCFILLSNWANWIIFISGKAPLCSKLVDRFIKSVRDYSIDCRLEAVWQAILRIGNCSETVIAFVIWNIMQKSFCYYATLILNVVWLKTIVRDGRILLSNVSMEKLHRRKHRRRLEIISDSVFSVRVQSWETEFRVGSAQRWTVWVTIMRICNNAYLQ